MTTRCSHFYFVTLLLCCLVALFLLVEGEKYETLPWLQSSPLSTICCSKLFLLHRENFSPVVENPGAWLQYGWRAAWQRTSYAANLDSCRHCQPIQNLLDVFDAETLIGLTSVLTTTSDSLEVVDIVFLWGFDIPFFTSTLTPYLFYITMMILVLLSEFSKV